MNNERPHLPRSVLALVIFPLLACTTLDAKVTLHAHYDGSTANADFAIGDKVARPAIDGSYRVAGTSSGRWGRGLDMTDGGANCIYDAVKNFNPLRGTVELWFRINEHKAGMYHPLFGFYQPPHQPGAKQRISAMEVYLHDSALVLGLHTPKYKGFIKPAQIKIGQWHHLEINWDCERGSGQSVYNIFLDGKGIIRVLDGGAIQGGSGAKLHIGIWDYGFSHITRGQIDELRITDQIEHSADFKPPTEPYSTPGTIPYANTTHRITVDRLKQFRGEIRSLMEFSGTEGDTVAAKTLRDSMATAKEIERKLESTAAQLTKGEKKPAALCRLIDRIADELSTARIPIHRNITRAASLAAAEDRRSLLFKDLNDKSAGNAPVARGRQLFIDDYMIHEIIGAKRILLRSAQDVRQLPKDLRLEQGSLLFDGKSKRFQLWSLLKSKSQSTHILSYSTSSTGTKWNKPQTTLPLRIDSNFSIYHQSLQDQPWLQRTTSIDNSRLLRAEQADRFVAVDARESGRLTTRPFIAIGDTLVLNAEAQGEIRVEAIDALGRVIEGFAEKDCKSLKGDHVEHVVSWAGNPNCHPLQARPIRLRFYLRNARLYSYEFRIRHNHYVPESYRQD